MWLKFTRLFAFLATFSLSGAYIITPNIMNGIPSGLDITNITDPFQKIGYNYYYFESNQLNWFAAFEACRRMKADLVAFDNYDELELVYQHIIRHKLNEGRTYWTSGTDLDIQHKHVWFSTGQPVTSNLWLRKGGTLR